MPFIRGRYHINPVMGQALEAARQAEAALAALEQRARQNSASDQSGDQLGNHSGDDSGADSYGDDATGFRSAQGALAKGPVHRVEIEAAAIVPNHSGKGQRGFVARIHHAPPIPNVPAGTTSDADGDTDDWRDPGSSSAAAPAPEIHVFADHGDLIDFLRDALASDANR